MHRAAGDLVQDVVQAIDACTAVVGSSNGPADNVRSAMSTNIRIP
jgi:hypothetical protein